VIDAPVSVRDLSKRFKLYRSPWHRIVEWITSGLVVRHETFWALRNISFEVRRGECFGVIGVNGAGKTTLLKILSRALYPTAGDFTIEGRIVSLLELGTGFHPELTGRQNIFQSARLLGFPEEEVRSRLPAILEFAEIGEFIDQPVKQYSSGMFVRLAFSLFAHLEPDVYIVDEALSVGDIFFQQKCFEAFRDLRRRGCTILFVSHDMEAVTHLCDRAILLSGGRVVSEGDPRSVVHDYLALMGQSAAEARTGRLAREGIPLSSGVEQMPEEVRHLLKSGAPGSHADVGSQNVEIVGFSAADRNGRPTWSVMSGETLRFWYLIEAREPCDDLNVGIHFYDRRGILVFAIGAANRAITLPQLDRGQQLVCVVSVVLRLQPGEYTIVPQVAGWQGAGDLGVVYDRLSGLPPVVVSSDMAGNVARFYGLVELETEIAWTAST
jgi:ABC-type polysaccharide/polyol phosphate transport system ATPase subunit